VKEDEMGRDKSTHQTEVKLTKPSQENMKEINRSEGLGTEGIITLKLTSTEQSPS
jgi:hypothetical protein